MMARTKKVPQVDPSQLMEALGIVYGWAENGDEADTWDGIGGEELFDVLGRIRRALDVEPPTAIALFQRSLALFSFCADAELSHVFFEEGFPGRELCTAASKAAVLNEAHIDQGEIGPYFDAVELRNAFRAALN